MNVKGVIIAVSWQLFALGLYAQFWSNEIPMVFNASDNIKVMSRSGASHLLLDRPTLSFAYRNIYRGSASLSSVFLYTPLKKSGLGLFAQRYGNEKYQERNLGINYGIRFSPDFMAAIHLNQKGLAIAEGYGQYYFYTAGFGARIQLNKENALSIGVSDIIQWRNSAEYFPTFHAGTQSQFSEQLRFYLDLNKTLDKRIMYRLGFDYTPVNTLLFLLSWQKMEVSNQLGFQTSLKQKYYTLELGLMVNSHLPETINLGVLFYPNK